MPTYEGTITFRYHAPSRLTAELYIDGLCAAMRYNKPEIAEKYVLWNIAEVSDDLTYTEGELNGVLDPPDETADERLTPLQLPPPDPED